MYIEAKLNCHPKTIRFYLVWFMVFNAKWTIS